MGLFKHLFEGVAIYAKRDLAKYDKYRALGKIKHDSGNFIGAIADFSIAIEANPVGPVGYLSRAMARECAGDLEGAMEDSSKHIELLAQVSLNYADNPFPYVAPFLLLRAKLSIKQNKLPEAFHDCKLLNEQLPDDDSSRPELRQLLKYIYDRTIQTR